MPRNHDILVGFVSGLLVATIFGTLYINDISKYVDLLSSRLDSEPPLIKCSNRSQPNQQLKHNRNHTHSIDDTSVTDALKQKVRILIWICTAPQNLNSKTRYIKDTWAKRADKVLYFSSETDRNFPTIGLNTSEGKKHLIAKTMQAFQYIYEHHRNDYDWFMKADDDTYILIENLRYFLSDKNPRDPIFFGKLLEQHVKQGFYSGGSGYVLSREALERLGTKGNDSKTCKQDGWTEDVEMSRCMQKLNVSTTNSNDIFGRSRFHPLNPAQHLFGTPEWFSDWDVNKGKIGQDAISNYPISFHYVQGQEMVTLDFFFYHVRLYGVMHVPLELNP